MRPIWSSMVSVNLRGFSFAFARTKSMPSRMVSEGSLLLSRGRVGREARGQRFVFEMGQRGHHGHDGLRVRAHPRLAARFRRAFRARRKNLNPSGKKSRRRSTRPRRVPGRRERREGSGSAGYAPRVSTLTSSCTAFTRERNTRACERGLAAGRSRVEKAAGTGRTATIYEYGPARNLK